MTIVKVNIIDDETPEVVHRIGNWYKTDYDTFILANIEGKIALVSLADGHFWSKGLEYVSTTLTLEQFSQVCFGAPESFTLINNVEINIS